MLASPNIRDALKSLWALIARGSRTVTFCSAEVTLDRTALPKQTLAWNGINRGQVLKSINALNLTQGNINTSIGECELFSLGAQSFSPDTVKFQAEEVQRNTTSWFLWEEVAVLNFEGLAAFRTFLKSEFSEENVEFWLACEDFKKTKSSTKIASKAQKIYADFIQADAPKEINIDFHTKNDISENISEPTLSCFDAAQRAIYCLMAKDSFPRFLRSEVYKELVKKHQDRNQKRWLPFL